MKISNVKMLPISSSNSNWKLATLALATLATMATFAKTFEWRISTPSARAETFTAYHGETVRFNLVFSGAMSNVSAQAIYYQTNGMGSADYFPPIPGTVFAPSNDIGAAEYRFFIRCRDADGVDYTANGRLRLLDSPGFEPSVVELPVKSLDFANVSVANAPYYTKTETDSRIVELSPTPGDYETVSNRASNARSKTDLAVYTMADWHPGYSDECGFFWDGELGVWVGRNGSGFEGYTLSYSETEKCWLYYNESYTRRIPGSWDDLTLNIGTEITRPSVLVAADDALAKTSRVAQAAQAATNYTDEAVASIPAPDLTGYAKTNDIQQVRMIVATWERFLDGSNVVFSITNYISGAYNLDAAKLKILELRDGEYREVYNSRDEIVMHIDNFRTNDFRTATNQVIGTVVAALGGKADKDWGRYTSSGGEAPPNTVYMTAPSTVFGGGLEYERVAVGEGTVCVLATKGAPVWTQGDEGMFKFHDDGGTNYFGFAKTDSYTIGCNTDGIAVQGSLLTLTYDITMSGHPCVWYKASLLDAVWEQLNLPDGSAAPGASYAVSWETTPPPGKQYCYINIGSAPAGFFRSTVEVAGEAKFLTNMPADLSGGLLCTNSVTGAMGVIKPNYNGSTVTWTWSAR